MVKAELGSSTWETPLPTASSPWSTPPVWGSARSRRPCRSTKWSSAPPTPERIKNIIADYKAGKTVDYRTLPRTTNPLSDNTASGDELVLLANVDQIDPLSLDAYLERGGYEGLKKALGMSQEDVVNTVKDAGLRGRGGAGFPPA